MSGKDINSHIQMPKFMLKKFVDSKGRLYAYDFEKKHNSYSTPSAINTEKGYYSAEAELILSQQIETPFSKIVNKICNTDLKTPLNFTRDEIDIVYQFILSLLSRDKDMSEGTKEKSFCSILFEKQDWHDLIAVKGISMAKEIGILKDYNWTVIVNISIIPFILPTSGLYSFAIENKEHDIEQYIVLPLCEDKALLLYENKYKDKFIKGNFTTAMFVREKEMNFFNETATLMQKKKGYGFVVSSSKQIIDELVNQYCN